jgi:hypothetical protein
VARGRAERLRRENRSEAACAGVRRYLQSFPQGIHATEANRLLQNLQGAAVPPPPPPNGTGPKIATDPATGAELLQKATGESQEAGQKAMEAVKEAVKAGHDACIKTCRQVCVTDKSCRSSCEEQCP